MNPIRFSSLITISCMADMLVLDYIEVFDVTARQRYSWKRLRDLYFTIIGTGGKQYDTSFTVQDDVAGAMNITTAMVKNWHDSGLTNVEVSG